jgi:hypothetical protein
MIAAVRRRIMHTMKNHIGRAVIVVAVLTAAHPFEGLASFVVAGTMQDAAAKAAAVLAGARQALGGADTLRAVKTLQAAGDVRRSVGEMQLEGELELLIEAPGRMRRNEAIGMPGGGTMVRSEVLNGAEVWDDTSQRGGMGGHMVMMRGPGGREMSEDEMQEMRRRMRRADLARYMLAWLLTTDAPMLHAGVAEAPDGTADVLEVKPAEGAAVRLFIDRQTHRPLMISWTGPQPRMMIRRGAGPGAAPNPDQMRREGAADGPPPQATFEMRFDDYRAVDGIQLPHLISRAVNGSVNEEWTIKSYKVNASFKNNTFTK